MVRSATEETWTHSYINFQNKYSEKKRVLDYVIRQWIPLITRFVSAWTNEFMHFNSLNTSRVEGAHSALKMYLEVLTMDMWYVCNKIELALLNSVAELRAAISGCANKV